MNVSCCFTELKALQGKGFDVTTIDLVSREKVLRDLAETRYGQGAEPISRSTLWRWCVACGVAKNLSAFTPHETARLHEVAWLLARGAKFSEVKKKVRAEK